MKEYYYVALTDINGWHWTTFLSRPDQSDNETTGFIAVTYKMETPEEAEMLSSQTQ